MQPAQEVPVTVLLVAEVMTAGVGPLPFGPSLIALAGPTSYLLARS
jgi:hypothetical protein